MTDAEKKRYEKQREAKEQERMKNEELHRDRILQEEQFRTQIIEEREAERNEIERVKAQALLEQIEIKNESIRLTIIEKENRERRQIEMFFRFIDIDDIGNITDMLKSGSIDINTINIDGYNALLYAYINNKIKSADILEKYGADIFFGDNTYGKTFTLESLLEKNIECFKKTIKGNVTYLVNLLKEYVNDSNLENLEWLKAEIPEEFCTAASKINIKDIDVIEAYRMKNKRKLSCFSIIGKDISASVLLYQQKRAQLEEEELMKAEEREKEAIRKTEEISKENEKNKKVFKDSFENRLSKYKKLSYFPKNLVTSFSLENWDISHIKTIHSNMHRFRNPYISIFLAVIGGWIGIGRFYLNDIKNGLFRAAIFIGFIILLNIKCDELIRILYFVGLLSFWIYDIAITIRLAKKMNEKLFIHLFRKN